MDTRLRIDWKMFKTDVRELEDLIEQFGELLKAATSSANTTLITECSQKLVFYLGTLNKYKDRKLDKYVHLYIDKGKFARLAVEAHRFSSEAYTEVEIEWKSYIKPNLWSSNAV
jgi:hypothetical protein